MSSAEIVTLACWALVVVVWIAGAVYGARGKPGSRQGTTTGTLWQIGAAILVVVVYHFGIRYLHGFSDDSWWIVLPGLALLVVSTGFTLWARYRLGRMWSASPDMLQADHQLRTDGPYAVTRHPIYTGLLGMILGSVLLNGLGPSLGLVAVGVVVFDTRIPIEERLMEETFPDEYPRYRERVPRLIPRPRLRLR